MPNTKRYGFPVSGSHSHHMQETRATFFGGALFLQKSAKNDETIASAFGNASCTLPLRERCDALCVLNEFSILWANSASPPEIELCFRAEQWLFTIEGVAGALPWLAGRWLDRGRGLPMMEVLTLPIRKTSTCLTLPSNALT
jgi:hypothetical protein